MYTSKIKYVCARQVTPPGGVQWRRADAGNTRHATGTVDTRAHTPAGPTPPPRSRLLDGNSIIYIITLVNRVRRGDDRKQQLSPLMLWATAGRAAAAIGFLYAQVYNNNYGRTQTADGRRGPVVFSARAACSANRRRGASAVRPFGSLNRDTAIQP